MKKRTEQKAKNKIKTKGWSIERRQKQKENCLKTKPWQSSTGPQTNKGKKIASLNATKTAHHSKAAKQFKKLLTKQRKFLNILIKLL